MGAKGREDSPDYTGDAEDIDIILLFEAFVTGRRVSGLFGKMRMEYLRRFFNGTEVCKSCIVDNNIDFAEDSESFGCITVDLFLRPGEVECERYDIRSFELFGDFGWVADRCDNFFTFREDFKCEFQA